MLENSFLHGDLELIFKFNNVLARAGIDSKMVIKIIKTPGLATKIAELLKKETETSLHYDENSVIKEVEKSKINY